MSESMIFLWPRCPHAIFFFFCYRVWYFWACSWNAYELFAWMEGMMWKSHWASSSSFLHFEGSPYSLKRPPSRFLSYSNTERLSILTCPWLKVEDEEAWSLLWAYAGFMLLEAFLMFIKLKRVVAVQCRENDVCIWAPSVISISDEARFIVSKV